MYLYFDESIRDVDGKKYITLGCVLYSNLCKVNIIKKETSNMRNNLKFKDEIKFTKIRDEKIKTRVLKNIKENALFTASAHSLISESENIHTVINKLLINIISDIEKEFKPNQIKIIYDKSTYQINNKSIQEKFEFITEDVIMRNSKNEPGIQHADWIAGEASEMLKQKNQK